MTKMAACRVGSLKRSQKERKGLREAVEITAGSTIHTHLPQRC
jgi:hypothetical protein